MILDDIVRGKKQGLTEVKKKVSLDELQICIRKQSPARDMAAALGGKGISLIAEVKKASPSRGMMKEKLDPVALAVTYAFNGASAISVLTEKKYFKGSLEYLSAVKKSLKDGPPILRKDFIFEPYQIYESRAYGADCLLLIVAILEDEQLEELLILSRELGMNCLIETRNEREVERALGVGAEIIGINNRDLTTFEVDLNTTTRLRALIPEGHIVVSESGIKSREDVLCLSQCGVDAVLVGEMLVTAEDTAAKMRELLL